jgi:hypothetical protein
MKGRTLISLMIGRCAGIRRNHDPIPKYNAPHPQHKMKWENSGGIPHFRLGERLGRYIEHFVLPRAHLFYLFYLLLVE